MTGADRSDHARRHLGRAAVDRGRDRHHRAQDRVLRAGARGPGLLGGGLRRARPDGGPGAVLARATWARCRSPCSNALAAHPVETLRPGDAILLNDPLLGSGHFPDFFITQPAFHDGDGWSASRSTSSTTPTSAAQRPGSQGVEGIFDYFQEGLRIPPTKVWKAYQEQEGVVGIIAANTRTPDKVLGDLRAQRSALRVGELRLVRAGRALRARHAAPPPWTRSSRAARRACARRIRAIPDGVYTVRGLPRRLRARAPIRCAWR